MRELVLQMMTTLNGRLDAPYAWVASVTEDQYEAIVAHYADYDTILVGHSTYDEMVSYWPSALESGEGSASNQRMAQHMHDYRKVVISREERQLQPWNNMEQRTAADDTGLIGTINHSRAKRVRQFSCLAGPAWHGGRLRWVWLMSSASLSTRPSLPDHLGLMSWMAWTSTWLRPILSGTGWSNSPIG